MDKTCTRCHLSKPVELFKKRGDRRGLGYRSRCRACENDIRRIKRGFVKKTEEQKREARRLYRKAYRAMRRAQRREARLALGLPVTAPVKLTEQEREERRLRWNAKERARSAHKRRMDGIKPRVMLADLSDDERRKRRAEAKAVYRRNRKLKERSVDGSHTAEEVRAIHAAQRYKCAICRVSTKNHMHVDHIRPLALGGSNFAENLQILCPACNMRKAAKDPVVAMQEVGFLL